MSGSRNYKIDAKKDGTSEWHLLITVVKKGARPYKKVAVNIFVFVKQFILFDD